MNGYLLSRRGSFLNSCRAGADPKDTISRRVPHSPSGYDIKSSPDTTREAGGIDVLFQFGKVPKCGWSLCPITGKGPNTALVVVKTIEW